MEKAYDPKKTEEKIYELWEKSGYFNPDKLSKSYPPARVRSGEVGRGKLKAKSYTILLPPPNITGSLHLGHALNATISDILIRYHRLKGERTAWLPGIDHAGIATQNVVEKELKKEGKSRFDLGREEFIERVWQWKEKYGEIILGQLKKIGVSCDWSRTRFTLDDGYAQAVKKAFVHYYEKGLIYRGERVVNWCPRCQTGLSDLEVEYKEEDSKLWHIRYPLEENRSAGRRIKSGGSQYIVIATTRPETMLGDAAVAVNPADKRYKNLIGRKAILPIQNRSIEIIADEAIDMDFGTGAVKVTPAHDFLDAEIAERHHLPFHQVIDEKGRMTEKAGYLCQSQSAAECREKVVAELTRLNLIEKIEDHKHNVARCYRCSSKLEPILSRQWFLKMKELAKKTAEAVKSKRVKIIPENFAKPHLHWLKNIKDWCVSRQLWWGHRIPAWSCVCRGKEKIYVGLRPPKTKCGDCGTDFVPSEDVLDTWFSSALWPFAGLSEDDLKDLYPSDVLITARDILNLWVGRMIFSGLKFLGREPFADVLIHGTILTKEGKRMSKSLGTGVDPLALVEKYGADALRFGLIWQTMGNQDIRWSEEHVLAGKKFANKIWNASRFVLRQTENPKSEILNTKQILNSKFKTTADKKILEELEITKSAIASQIENYEFGPALHQLYDFFWHSFCDIYLEECKKQDAEVTAPILLGVLLESLKMLHPFMPFVTEEIYQQLPYKDKKSLLMIEEW